LLVCFSSLFLHKGSKVICNHFRIKELNFCTRKRRK